MAGKKLLVADDSLTIQKVIRLALSNEGYEIQAVSDGNDAIQQISLFRPDVVLIDVSLPGKTAFEVKRSINEMPDLEEVRFVLMSSAFEKVDEEQLQDVNFHGRLTKPFDPAHLRQILSEVLAQVTAKRMEPTSLLSRPTPEELRGVTPPPPPAHDEDMPADELPTVPEPEHIEIDQLWDKGEGVTPQSDDSDIRHLTESTIRISGLDDFQWSVQEPSLRPSPEMADLGGSQFEIEPSPLLRPIGEPRPDSSVRLEPPKTPPPPPPSFQAQSGQAQAAAPQSPHLEDLIRRQVQETLEKMIQKVIPDVAERIIKEEIHKMLTDHS